MRVGMLGINHKLADLHLRELLAKTCQRSFGGAVIVHPHDSLVLLSTCNRTEIYFSSEDLAETHSYLLGILRQQVDEDIDQKLYSFFGFDCFLHLLKVTAGLDSAIVAETEIQGQVKCAYEQAADRAWLPSELHYLFQKSLKIGKQVRSQLLCKQGLPEIEHLLYAIGKDFFLHENPKILFVGCSEINKRILAYFRTKPLYDMTICNRSEGIAEGWEEQYNLNSLSWNKLENWIHYDWVIFGTKSHEHLAHASDLPIRFNSRKLLIDLSVPRNIDPQLSRSPLISLFNIDEINRALRIKRGKVIDNLMQAEHLLTQSAKLHVSLYQQKEARRQSASHALAAG